MLCAMLRNQLVGFMGLICKSDASLNSVCLARALDLRQAFLCTEM